MSRLLPDDQVSEAYRRTRQSVLELLTQIPESSATVRVPACPDWTVQQTVSHFVGVPEDLLAGRMEGVASDEWTNAQVRHHEGESLAELATALEATIIPFDAILPAIPRPSNSQLVMDAVTHEIDLREALGLPCVDSSPSLTVARALSSSNHFLVPRLATNLKPSPVPTSSSSAHSLDGSRSRQWTLMACPALRSLRP